MAVDVVSLALCTYAHPLTEAIACCRQQGSCCCQWWSSKSILQHTMRAASFMYFEKNLQIYFDGFISDQNGNMPNTPHGHGQQPHTFQVSKGKAPKEEQQRQQRQHQHQNLTREEKAGRRCSGCRAALELRQSRSSFARWRTQEVRFFSFCPFLI